MTRKDAKVEAVPAEATAQAPAPAIWIAENFAEYWYRDALSEARGGQGVDSIRREIVFATCFAASYIFEWARGIVGVEAINNYFPPGSYRILKCKWRDVPEELHRDGKIPKAPKLNLSKLGTLITYRNGLVHAGASRPATASQPQKAKPVPTRKMLKAKGSGWAVGVVADLVEKLHDELGTPKPEYLTDQERMMLSKDELKAYHEAGHVVAHCVVDLRFDEVNIDRGEVKHPKPRRATIAQHIICALAGPAASERIGDKPCVGDHDVEAARLLPGWWFTGEDVRRTFFDGLCETARAVVQEPSNWAAVEALAQELCHKRTMSANEVLSFFREHGLLDVDRLSWKIPVTE